MRHSQGSELRMSTKHYESVDITACETYKDQTFQSRKNKMKLAENRGMRQSQGSKISMSQVWGMSEATVARIGHVKVRKH
jgi:hypothetical protein